MKKLFFLVFLVACCLFPVSRAHAKDFSSYYKTTYEFNAQEEGLVNQEISLVNNTDNLYVSRYSLSLSGGEISRIEAYDNLGKIKTEVLKKDDSTIITLNFNEKAAGRGKTLTFLLKYKIVGLAKKEGNLWQIAIPRLANHEEIDEYQLKIKMPQEYGRIAFVNPSPALQYQEGGWQILEFSKPSLINFGVLAVFGQYQTFDFKLSYRLQNLDSSQRVEKIALPPDTAYQKVSLFSIDPLPLDVEVDPDGNWLASYLLAENEELIITVQGQAKVFSQPSEKILIKPPGEKHLAAQPNWPVNNREIRALGAELKTPQKIYEYVLKTLRYDYNRVNEDNTRLGALGALNNPHSVVCTEFADLFVALARAAGIPARELEGYAWADNPKLASVSARNDLLHSWAEYYSEEKKQWLMVDPTWEQTTGGLDYFNKFDMAHLVFVIHGQSDHLPLPPGSYKGDFQEKQVLVSLGEDIPNQLPAFSLERASPLKVFTLKKNKLLIEGRNTSGLYFEEKWLSLEGEPLVTKGEWKIANVPPFGKFRVETEITPREMIKDYQTTLVLRLDETRQSLSLGVLSLCLRGSLIGGGAVAVIIVLLLLSLRRSWQKKAENVKLGESG